MFRLGVAHRIQFGLRRFRQSKVTQWAAYWTIHCIIVGVACWLGWRAGIGP